MERIKIGQHTQKVHAMRERERERENEREREKEKEGTKCSLTSCFCLPPIANLPPFQTGYFLDQRWNRKLFAHLAKGKTVTGLSHALTRKLSRLSLFFVPLSLSLSL